MVTFRSSDGVVFEVEEKVAELSLTIKHMIDDGCAETVIPLPNVTATTLAKVVEYCKKHLVKERSSDEKAELKKWDREFVKFDHFPPLLDLIMAAHYLNIEDLLDLTCQTTADMIKDMSPEEVRQLFNITNDFTPEEEEEVRRENQWAFE